MKGFVPDVMAITLTQEALKITKEEAEDVLIRSFGKLVEMWSGPDDLGEPSLVSRIPNEGLPTAEFVPWLKDQQETAESVRQNIRVVAGEANVQMPNRQRGGRPPEYDWDRIWAEAVILAAEQRVSDTQSTFLGDLRVRLEKEKINCPDPETLRKKLKDVHRRLIDLGLARSQFEPK